LASLIFFGSLIFQSVALASNLDNLGPVQDAIQDSGCGRYVTDQFAPVVQGPVGGHDGGAQLVPSHDDLEEILAGPPGQLFDTHVIDYQKIDFEITVHGSDAVAQLLGLDQFGDGVKARAIQRREPDCDRSSKSRPSGSAGEVV